MVKIEEALSVLGKNLLDSENKIDTKVLGMSEWMNEWIYVENPVNERIIYQTWPLCEATFRDGEAGGAAGAVPPTFFQM